MTRYTLTEEQYQKVLAASTSAPLILLQCTPPPSLQELVNQAWQEIAKEHGCRWDTIQPAMNGNPLDFLAEPE